MIVGLCGRARTGKDTVADILEEAFGGIYRIQIAAPIKTFCRQVFDWTTEHTDGPLKDVPDTRYPRTHDRHVLTDPGTASESSCRRCGWSWRTTGCQDPEDYGPCTTHLTPREAMQTLGADWSAPLYEPIWAVMAVRQAKHFSRAVMPAVVTDCRFLHDIKAVREAGGIIVQVHRPGLTGMVGTAGTHRSETEQDSPEFQRLVHHHIHNDGTLDDLKKKITLDVQARVFSQSRE